MSGIRFRPKYNVLPQSREVKTPPLTSFRSPGKIYCCIKLFKSNFVNIPILNLNFLDGGSPFSSGSNIKDGGIPPFAGPKIYDAGNP
jgi:hypothetical protein